MAAQNWPNLADILEIWKNIGKSLILIWTTHGSIQAVQALVVATRIEATFLGIKISSWRSFDSPCGRWFLPVFSSHWPGRLLLVSSAGALTVAFGGNLRQRLRHCEVIVVVHAFWFLWGLLGNLHGWIGSAAKIEMKCKIHHCLLSLGTWMTGEKKLKRKNDFFLTCQSQFPTGLLLSVREVKITAALAWSFVRGWKSCQRNWRPPNNIAAGKMRLFHETSVTTGCHHRLLVFVWQCLQPDTI